MGERRGGLCRRWWRWRWLRRRLKKHWKFVIPFLFVTYNIVLVYLHSLAGGITEAENGEIFISVPKFGAVSRANASRNIRQSSSQTGGGSLYDVKQQSIWNNSLVEGDVDHYLQSGLDLWDHSTILPQWMKDYFAWHKLKRQWLESHRGEWNSQKYYLVECSDDFNSCGGTADRLAPLPFHVKMAAAAYVSTADGQGGGGGGVRRILFIHWSKEPAGSLENYLLPPQGGVDWRVPPWLLDNFLRESKSVRMATYEDNIEKFGRNEHVRLLRVKYQSFFHGREYYDSNTETPALSPPTRQLDDNILNPHHHPTRNASAQAPRYSQVYHDLWRVFFTPVPAIAREVEEQMELLGLVPGGYVSTHVRAYYAVQERSEGLLRYWAHNAINCANDHFPVSVAATAHRISELYQDTDHENHVMPILFVSDSVEATRYAQEYAAAQKINVAFPSHMVGVGKEPLHLEKAASSNQTNVEDYFDTFVDLYLLGMSRCTAYSMGGYGRWGSMIGYNSSCSFFMKPNAERCNVAVSRRFNSKDPMQKSSTYSKPLFLPPMTATPSSSSTDGRVDQVLDRADIPDNQRQDNQRSNRGELTDKEGEVRVNTRESNGLPFSDDESSSVRPAKSNYISKLRPLFDIINATSNLGHLMKVDPYVYTPYMKNLTGGKNNLWFKSDILPEWLKEYFRWHRVQRRKYLHPQHWRSARLLVMECLEHQPKCGGTSDRLKPFLTLARIAQATNRILLIHWDRPAPLEEFLLPPKGGVDWRVPLWLRPLLADYGIAASDVGDVNYAAKSGNGTVRTRCQSYTGLGDWYDEQLAENEPSFQMVFSEAWKIFFTPSPPIAIRIKDFLDEHNLIPGTYASAHVRVLYALESRPLGIIKRWARNGVNCASRLRPGRPIFFASDSKDAAEMAIEWGARKNATVLTHPNNPNPPLHFDKSENTTDADGQLQYFSVSAFYDTFIDLYLLALGRCVFISKGGYGHWAALIGGNMTCVIKQKRNKKGIHNPCNWTNAPNGSYLVAPEWTQALFLEPMHPMVSLLEQPSK